MEKISDFLSVNSGYGNGYGDGSGSGSGDAFGSGFGSGISQINGRTVYQIDGVETILTNIKGNVAKGYVLRSDLSLASCYVAKGHNMFAHGITIQKAVDALQEKIFQEIDAETAISMFLKKFSDPNKKYPAKDFYVWHHHLTGSCEIGRDAFVKDGGYDLENDTFTVHEFIEITKNSYGGDIIRQLENALKDEIEKGQVVMML